jgi:hypothetical protein
VHLAVVAALCLLVLAVVPAVQAEALRWLAAAAVQLAWAAQWTYLVVVAIQTSAEVQVRAVMLQYRLVVGMHCYVQGETHALPVDTRFRFTLETLNRDQEDLPIL